MFFLDVEPLACEASVFTRIVYGNGQNNECLPGCLHSFILSGLDKMHLLSTSESFGEVVETPFIKQRNKWR